MNARPSTVIGRLGLAALITAGVFACGASARVDAEAGSEDDLTTLRPGCEPKDLEPWALGGTILTPGGPVEGYVVVRDEKIAGIVSKASEIDPDITHVVETGGVISPGLVDLHNHVAYDFIPLWNAGRRFTNRYQWARTDEYAAAVKNDYNAVKNAKHACDAIKYGEFRALAGGTTTIQGSSNLGCVRSWARNVEFLNFCEDKVRQRVLPVDGIDEDAASRMRAQFEAGDTKAFLIHLAEGVDDASRKEFEVLRSHDLLVPEVVGIHATALTEEQLEVMGKAGMKIVWSPLSNLILYGQTTKIPAALRAGVKVALAPDWSPSGSANLLGELKIADRVNREQFDALLSDEDLWRMATSIPAEIVGLDDKLGSIEVGKAADLLVVEKGKGSAYRSIIDAAPQNVLLTVVGGDVFYGEPSLVEASGSARPFETVDACGAPRLLGVQEADPRLANGMKSLAEIVATFEGDGVKNVIPLIDCTTSQFEFAFDPEPRAR